MTDYNAWQTDPKTTRIPRQSDALARLSARSPAEHFMRRDLCRRDGLRSSLRRMEKLSGKMALVTGSTDGSSRLVALDKPSARLNSAGLGAILPYHRLTNGLRKRNEFGS